jgi:hypothetical protein
MGGGKSADGDGVQYLADGESGRNGMKIKEAGERVAPTVELSVVAAIRTPWEYQVSRSLVGWSISADGNVALLVSKSDALMVIAAMERDDERTAGTEVVS